MFDGRNHGNVAHRLQVRHMKVVAYIRMLIPRFHGNNELTTTGSVLFHGSIGLTLIEGQVLLGRNPLLCRILSRLSSDVLNILKRASD